MSANLHQLAPDARSAAGQELVNAGVYSFITRDQLALDERDAQKIEDRYGLSASHQAMLGYVSAPRPRRYVERDESTSKWLDSLDDDAFLDFFTYSREPVYKERRCETGPAADYSEIEAALFERFGDLGGVPGLYSVSRPRLRTFSPYAVIVPCRSHGIIQALQVYPRPGSDQFHWYSTPKARDGASVRATLHTINEHLADGLALLLTHTIAADAEGWANGVCAIATNGINSLRLPHALRSVLPNVRALVVSDLLGEMTARILRENGFDVEISEMEGARHE